MNTKDIKAELEKRECELEAELVEVRRMLGKDILTQPTLIPYPVIGPYVPSPYDSGWLVIIPPPRWDPFAVPIDFTPQIVCDVAGGGSLPSSLNGIYFRQ